MLLLGGTALLAVVAFVGASRPLQGSMRDGHASMHDTAVRVGASAGAAVGVGLLVAVVWARGSSRRRSFGASLGRALAAVAVVAGLAALAAASTVPVRAAVSSPRPHDPSPSFDPLLRRVRARAEPGRAGQLIGADVDGTGRYLTQLHPCEGATFAPFAAPTGAALVPIDSDCNGVTDFYAELVDEHAPATGSSVTTTVVPIASPPSPSRDRRAALIAAAAAVAAAIGAVGALAARRRDRRPPPPELLPPSFDDRPLDRAQVARTVAVSVDVMLADPDPRTAIIGAYASLLDGLGEAGLPRHPQEGPEEHLRRCLTTLDVQPQPLRTITALFAEAKFSPHALGEQQRQAALDALRAAAGELEPVTAGAAP